MVGCVQIWGIIHGYTQGLLLVLCSEITPCVACGTLCSVVLGTELQSAVCSPLTELLFGPCPLLFVMLLKLLVDLNVVNAHDSITGWVIAE